MVATRELRAVLSRRGFRRMLGVRLSSQFADGLFQAGIGGSVLFNPQMHSSPVSIAAGFAILLLPYSMIGPYVGVFLDRWSRRNILVMANLTRALLIVPSAALLWFGHADLPFALIALVIIAVNRFFLACLSASLRHVVEDERLATANAVANTLGTIAFTAGLATAVGLLSVVGAKFHGYAIIVLTALLGYAASSLLAKVLFHWEALGPDAADRQRHSHLSVPQALAVAARGMVDGARHLRSRKVAYYALLAQGGARGLYGLLTIATLLFAKTMGHGKEFLGLVFAFGAVGALVAALVTPAATRKWGGQLWLLALLAVDAGAIAALTLSFKPWMLLGGVFVLNIASGGMKIVVDTSIQHECDDEYQGRVFSVNDTAFNSLNVVGLFIGAYLLPVDGRSVLAMVCIAAGYATLATWYFSVLRRGTLIRA
ncbi:MFS transporter [Longispora fulva]|uniref:MFS family permease n=1 Tax=Longispora fulva TaxID=619741 RepID=A0A8J7GK50_9ACTN|nr:MFS transporter [Longispora fulva]MBG6139646.1 MFS family permease [Longispora fulva]